jgi:hypothetical protein
MSNAPHFPPPYIERGAGDVNWWLGQQNATPKPREEIDRMTPAQKLDYCRRFDQSTMPVWKDPRG